ATPAPVQEGLPVPPVNSATAAPTQEELQYKRMAIAVRSRNKRTMADPLDAEIHRDETFKRAWNMHMAQRRAANGNANIQPIPPGQPLPSLPVGPRPM